MRNCNDIYKGCRYIPNREEMNKEFSGLISLEDFFTSCPTTHVVNKIVSTEIFNYNMKKIIKRKEDKKCLENSDIIMPV